MLPWFAPVLAQLITLDVNDRNEARYVVANDHRYEVAVRPATVLHLHWPSYDLALGYNVSLLETPVERAPRELLVFNTAALDAAYRIQHFTVSLNSTVSWGEVNFLVAALQSPVAPTSAANPNATPGGATPNQPQTPNGGTPDATNPGTTPGTMPGTGTPQAPSKTGSPFNQVVDYRTWTTTLRVADQPTRQLKLGTFIRYTTAGGLNDDSLAFYAITSAKTVGVDVAHLFAFTGRDTFVTSSVGQHTWSSNGNHATSVVSNELWTHRFDRRMSTGLGAGLSLTRISQPDGLIAYSVFPNFTADFTYQTQHKRQQFAWQTTAYSAPALDPLRATVDPQVGLRQSLRFSRDRFSSTLSGNVGVSIASPQANAGAFDSYQASFINAFRLSDWAQVDAGGRVVQQQFRGGALVPFSYAVFVGLQFGYLVPLHGRAKR